MSDSFSEERKLLHDVPNVYSYQAFKETDKGGYMIRQWVASSLYDRIRYQLTSFQFVTVADTFKAHVHSYP